MINRINRFIWRFLQRRKGGPLSILNVKLSNTVYFDKGTRFGGNNRIGSCCLILGSDIGKYTYMATNNRLDNVVIGNFCSIGSNIRIISTTHPSKEFVSTHPSFFSTLNQAGKTFVKNNKFTEVLNLNGRKLIVGSDVWIGDNVTFMGGVTIGDGAIIGAHALVTKDVPPYAIVGGVPAKVIRYRFDQEQIDRLLHIKWWNNSDEWLCSHCDEFEKISVFLDHNKQ